MPSNPFARDPAVSVGVGADTSAFSGAMDDAIVQLGSFKKAVGGAGLALGALATGALVKATSAARDWEDAMADVEKVTDPQTTEELSDGFQSLAEEIPIAAGDLAKLGEQAGKFGAEGSDEIMSFVETVGKIQTATDLSAEVAGKRFSKIAGAIGMPLSEIDSLGNAVNALADSMKTDADEITDTATRASNTLGQQFGLGEDAVIALSASMNEVSPSSRRAASSLRRAAESLMDPKKTEDLAAALGMNVDEFKNMRKENPEGLMNKVAKAMDDNGETAEELRGVLGKAATDFSKLGGQMGRTEEAQRKVNSQFEEGTSLQKEMGIRTNTFSGQMQLLRNKIGNVARSIGGQLLPHLTTLLKTLNGVVGALIDVNNRTNGAAATFGLVATAIGGFVVAGASAISMLGGMSAILGTVTAALSVLTGPIGLAVLAVAGLAAAWQSNFMNIQGHTRNFVSFLREAVGRLRSNIIDPFLSWMTAMWTQHFSGIANEVQQTASVWQSTIAGFVQWAKPYVQGFLDVIRAGWDRWGDEILAVTRFIFDAIKGYVEYTLDIIATTFKVMLRVLRGDWEGAWTLIKEFAIRTLRGILNFSEAWGSRFLGWVSGVIDGVIGYFQKLYRRLIGGSLIPEMFTSILSYARSWGSRFIGWTRNLISNIINSYVRLYTRLADALIPNMFRDILGTARRKGNDLVRSIRRTVSDMISSTQQGMDRMVSAVWSRLSQFRSAVDGVMGAGRRAITSSISEFRGAGSRLGSGIASGIRSKISEIRSAASDAMSAAKSYLPGSDADRGPLSDLTSTGEALSETFADGIRNGTNEIGNALKGKSHSQDYTDYGSVTRTRSGDRTTNDIDINVDASEGADGTQIGRDVSDELRSRGFGN